MPSRKARIILLVVLVLIAIIFFGSMAVGIGDGMFREKIGVVEISGVIAESKDVMEDIVRFKEDDSIKGVIIRINSPGGSVGPSQEIYSEVIKLKAKKKVYTSMGSVCASGGYYIAVAGEKIYAMPATITGSIGVIMEHMIVEDLFKKIGLQSNTIKSGAFKDAGTPFRKMKDDEKAYFQGILDGIHEQFIKVVAQERKLPVETVKKLSDGRIFIGTQAKDLKLVDNIGTFYDTVDGMRKALNMKDKPLLVYGKKPFSLMKWLVSSMTKEVISEYFSGMFKYSVSP
ncbi:MAG: signal peptide peptidase SppA [Proteobacteria bacterium]|nr:signal peptide peptidase SppA [Pseudomonadota bacterium]